MSNKNIDTRVVEMQFDNKQFEKDMSTTVKSLKNFEKSLEFKNSGKGFDELSKSVSNINSQISKVDFSALSSAVEKISDRCSVLGTIVFTTIQNLTNDAINTIKSKVDTLYNTIMEKGMTRALNLEQANFKLKGLLKDEKEVAKVMDNVSDAVSGTAYGLDEAASIASQLAASNVKSGNQMLHNLQAIAGVAAMTSSSYGEIGDIFAKIASQGRLSAQVLQQFSSRGLNVAAELAKQLGKTEAEIREIISSRDSGISFETFYEAMYKAYAEFSKKANETYNGALANVKAALGRVGAGFKQPYIKYMRPVFVQLIENINAVKDAFGPLYDTTSFVFEKLSTFAVNFLKTLYGTRKDGDKTVNTIKSIRDTLTDINKMVTNNWPKVEKFLNHAVDVSGAILNLLRPIGSAIAFVTSKLVGAFNGYASNLDKINQNGNGFIGFLKKLEVQLNVIYGWITRSWDDISKIISNIVYVVKTSINLILKIISPIKNAFFDVFPFHEIVEIIREISDAIAGVFGFISDTFKDATNDGDSLYNIFHAIFSVIKFGISILRKGFKIVGNIISFISPIIKLLITIAFKISDLINKIISLTFKSDKFKNVIAALNPHLKVIKDLFGNLKNLLAGAVSKAIENITNAFDWLSKKLEESGASFSVFGDKAKSASQKLNDFKDKTKETGKSIINSIKNNSVIVAVLERIASFFSFIWGKLKEFGSRISSWFSEVFANMKRHGVVSTIGTALTELTGSLSTALSNIIDKIGPIKESILKLFGSDSIFDIIQQFLSFFIEFNFAKLLKSFAGLGDSIKGFINKISSPLDTFKKKESKLKNLAKSILMISAALFIVSKIPLEALAYSVAALGAVVAAIVVVSNTVDSEADASKGAALKILAMSLFVKVLGNFMLKIAAVIAVLGALMSASDSLSVLALTGIVVGALGAVLAEIAIFLRVFSKTNINDKQILSLSLFIKLFSNVMIKMTAMVALLSLFDKEKIWNAAGVITVLGLLITAFTGIILAVSNKKGSGQLNKNLVLMIPLLKIFGSIVTKFAVLVAIISLLDPAKVWSSVGVMAALTIMLGGLIALTLLIKNDSLKKLIGLAIYVKFAGQAIKNMAIMVAILGLIPGTSALKGLEMVGIITAILAGLMFLTRFVDGTNMQKAAKGILIMSAAIAIIAVAVIKLSKAGVANVVLTLAALTLALFNLSAIAVALSIFAKQLQILGKAFMFFGTGVALFGAGIFLIVKSVKTLSRMGPKAIEYMTAMITAVITQLPTWIGLLLTGFVKALAEIGPQLAEALVNLLISAIEIMTKSAGRIVKAIGNLFQAIATTLASFSDAFDIKDLFWAVQSMALIAGLIFVLQVLSSDMKAALKGIVLMALVLTALVGAMAIINLFTNVDKMPLILGGIAAALSALAGTFAILVGLAIVVDKAKLSFGALMKTLGAFMIFMVGLVLTMGVIGFLAQLIEETCKKDVISWFEKAAIIMGLVGAAIGNFIGAITNAFFNQIKDVDASIGMILAVVPLILALEPLVLALPLLALFIGAIGAVVSAIDAWLGEGSSLAAFQKAAEVMGTIGEALGQFIGGVVHGILDQLSNGFMETLINFADGLSQFMVHLAPFLLALNMVNGAMLEKAGQLTLIMLEMCAVELISALTSFLSNFLGKGMSMSEFAKELADMAPYLVKFSNLLVEGGFDGDIATKAANAALMMANVANNLPKKDGWWQAIVGQTMDMDEFGSKLEGLGKSLVRFANSVSTLTPEQIEAMGTAAEAVSKLSDVANNMPKEGGLWQKIAGEVTDMDEFGRQLAGLGGALVQFAGSVSEIDNDQVEKVNNVIPIVKSLVEIGNSMPQSGGLWQKIVGEGMDMEEFGRKMKWLAVGLYNYAFNLSGIDEARTKQVENSIGIVTALVDISNALGQNKSGGIASWFGGDSKEDIKSFSEKLPILGEGISSFAEKTKDIGEMKNVEFISNAIIALSNAFQNTKDTGAFTGIFLGRLGALIHGDAKSGQYEFEDWYKASLLLGPNDGMPVSNETAKNTGNRIGYLANVVKALSEVFQATSNSGAFSATFLGRLGALVHGDSNAGQYTPDDWLDASTIFGNKLSNATGAYNRLKWVAQSIKVMAEVFSGTNAEGEFTGKFLSRLGALVHGDPNSGSYNKDGKDLQRASTIFGGKLSNATGAYNRLEWVKKSIDLLAMAFEGTSEINEDFVSKFLNALGMLVASDDKMFYASQLMGGSKKQSQAAYDRLSNVKDSIIALCEAFKATADLNNENVKTFVEALTTISNLSIDTIKDDLINRASEVVDAAKDLIKKLGEAFTDKKDTLKENVKTLLGAINTAVDEYKPVANENFKTFVNGCISTVNSFNSQDPSRPSGFYAAGIGSVTGYVRGIQSQLSQATIAGQNIGNAALQGTKNALKEKSPSRAYKDDIARNAVLGLVNGFAEYAYMASEAGMDLGNNALNGTKGIVTRISDVLNADMNLNPVITPILDLSEISDGSQRIGGILNTGATAYYARKANQLVNGRISLEQQRRSNNQNGSQDIIDTITSVNDRLDKLEEAIINRPIMLDKVKVSKEITPEVDKNLGRRAYYSRRGN